MTDKAEQLIADIHTKLDSLTGGTNPFGLGKLDRDEHRDSPYVSWLENGGSIGDAEKQKDVIATDTVTYRVSIWATTRENARAMLHNLILAARKTAYGPNVNWTTYEWSQDAHANKDYRLTITVELKLPVSNEVMNIVEVASQTRQVTVDGEVIC